VIKFFLGYIVPLFILAPLIVGLRGFRSFDQAAKTLVWYLIISAFTTIIAVYLAYNHINNMPVFHIFTILEFMILTLFYRHLAANRLAKQVLTFFICAFLVFGIINAIYIQPINTYNSLPRSIESLLLITFSLTSFYTSLGENNTTLKRTKDLLWINIGIICYFSGALFLFIFSEYIAKDPSTYRIGWIIHAVLLAAVLYTMITVYFIKTKNK